ncbi:MAG: PAS domain S-box protein [Nitrospirae bacterium]|nr:PAS domain S-box protein [Nitrospirota bacterium]
MISIFYFHNFPITFIEGRGVTAVKSYSEYLICLLLGISMILITKRKDKFETKVYQNLMSFAMLAMIGEFVFSSYRDLYSLENVIGHYFKLLSYYFLYNAVFVTGIKTPYQLLAKSREKYQTLTRFAPVGIFNLDEAGNMIYTNLRLSEISGLIREQINSVSWLEATYPIDKTTVNNQWKNTITSGMQFNMEYRIQSSSGKITWVQCLIDALKDEENNVVGFIGTVTDITERKLAVELMLKGEKLYKITFENAPIGIAHTSISGRFLRVNDRFCQIIGYTKEEIFKITRQSLIHPEEMDQDQTEITRLICGEVKSIGAEQRYIRKDKRVIYASLKISLFSKYNDSAEYLIVVFDDITKRKETERLVHKSLKEKRLLLGEIHHRVKNNLSIVDGLLKMQSLKVKDEYFKGLIFECQSRIASIALIHEKLYQSESIAEINFKLYIDSLIIKLRNTYSDDIERIKFNNMADEIYFDIDTATPLGLIINEILTNAVKHAFPDRSSGVIDIFLYQIKDDYGSQYYELIIKDNGAGFPDELDLYKSETLGLRLINGLASTQLNGQILFENKRRESKTISGAEIKIKFKKFTRVQGE